MKLSTVFPEGGIIPQRYTGDGADVNPPLRIEETPGNAKSLALIVEDPDAPSGTFHHWVLYNVDPKTREIKENSVPVIATQGRNDFGELEYCGPRPPSGEHRYYFKVLALDSVLNLPRGVKWPEIEKEISEHVLDQGVVMGRYARQGNH
jgi:Raf kinase inhibitor-like YbhB/YbcL family protein